MSATRPVVAVIDDDSQMRAALEGLLETIDIDVKSFARADDFLRSGHLDEVSCIVLDVRLPGPSGFDVQRELAKARVQAPIVFVTGHGDIPMTVRAMKAGALEFLAKPFRDQDLLDAVRQCSVRDTDCS